MNQNYFGLVHLHFPHLFLLQFYKDVLEKTMSQWIPFHGNLLHYKMMKLCNREPRKEYLLEIFILKEPGIHFD